MTDVSADLVVGASRVLERTFSPEEVRTFAELSGDRGVQHLQEDAQGRLMVHGLLLAALPTEVGGSMNFLARELQFEFVRPAWTSMKVRCTVTITAVAPTGEGTRLESTWTCIDPDGKLLMRGRARGLVPSPSTLENVMGRRSSSPPASDRAEAGPRPPTPP